MPIVSIPESPLLPGKSPVDLYYREHGEGIPLLLLHGGWGYQVYPFDRQIEALRGRFRLLAPDRTGYGRSMRIDYLPPDFHRQAAVETIALLDALEIDRALFWGHSDGAVISAMMAIERPERAVGVILEAFHFYRVKEGSRHFFEAMAEDPEWLGERIGSVLAADHGEDYWRKLITLNGRAWLKIAAESRDPKEDLYGGRLSELSVPALFIHGSRDPRTEPDELEAIRRELPCARIEVLEGAGHCPHSEASFAAASIRVAESFLSDVIAAVD